MAAFVKESRPSIRAFTLSAEGFELLKSFSAADVKFFEDYLFPRAKARFNAICWSEHIKIADLPL